MIRKAAIALSVAALVIASGVVSAQNPPAGGTPPPATQTPPPATQTPPPDAQTPPPATQTPAAAPEPTKAPEPVKYPEGPPPELKRLSALAGPWQEKTHVNEGMMGPATDYTGKSQFKWDFNGMHLVGTHNFQNQGKPVFGHSLWGWDYEQKKYQLVWVSSMMPTSYVYYGDFMGDNTLVLYSTVMRNGKAVTEKVTYVFADPTSYTFTLESDLSGTMTKVMETTAKKGAATPSASKKPAAKKSTTGTSSKKSG